MFRCICADGFEGEYCEVNIDDCEDNDCENNSTCVDGINNYTCLCPPEYTGRKCSNVQPSVHVSECIMGILLHAYNKLLHYSITGRCLGN